MPALVFLSWTCSQLAVELGCHIVGQTHGGCSAQSPGPTGDEKTRQHCLGKRRVLPRGEGRLTLGKKVPRRPSLGAQQESKFSHDAGTTRFQELLDKSSDLAAKAFIEVLLGTLRGSSFRQQ